MRLIPFITAAITATITSACSAPHGSRFDMSDACGSTLEASVACLCVAECAKRDLPDIYLDRCEAACASSNGMSPRRRIPDVCLDAYQHEGEEDLDAWEACAAALDP